MYWRLSTGARALVPNPFRPTPLQCGLGVPDLVIDFLNWADVRDQLILANGNVDLDEMVRDLVLNTVVEIPQRSVAVNVFRQYQSHLTDGGVSSRRGPPTPSSAVDMGWVFFETSRGDADFQSCVPDPVEEALVRELWRRVQLFTHRHELTLFPRIEPESSIVTAALESPLGLLDRRFCKDKTAERYGLADTRAWKLSKDFGAKYTFIDCSSGMIPSNGFLKPILFSLTVARLHHV